MGLYQMLPEHFERQHDFRDMKTLSAMFKDMLLLLCLCNLSPGRFINIALVNNAQLNAIQLLPMLTNFTNVEVVVLNVSLPNASLFQEVIFIRNLHVHQTLIVPEEMCNLVALMFQQQVLKRSVTCFRPRDTPSDIMLYQPVVIYTSSVIQILQQLKWPNVMIITDDRHGTRSLITQLLSVRIPCSAVFFNSSSTDSDFHHMLLRAAQNVYPWHFLLLSDIPDAIRVLRAAESYDVRNRRRSDMRSSSQWLVVVQEGDLKPFHTEIWVDNIALFVYPAIDIYSVVHEGYPGSIRGNIFTLMYRQFGRELEHIGMFHQDGPINLKSPIFPNTKYGLNGRLLTVSTMRWLPYTLIRNESGEIIFEGICIDILNELTKVMNFTYRMILPPDKEWGVKNSDGNYTGLVGQIQRNEIDMTAAALALAYERLDVMDFTYPFGFDHGVGIYKLPDSEADRWLILIRPFKWQIHLVIAAVFVACVMLLHVLRWWHTPLGDGDRCDTWMLMFGLFIRHSPVVKSPSVSSSFLISFVGLFGTVIAAIYCGNMIAFFTVTKQILPFRTLAEVVQQTTYKWGTLGGSLWAPSFMYSQDPHHRAYWDGIVNFNQTDPDVLDRILLFYERGLLDVWRRKWMTQNDKCERQRSVRGVSVSLLDLQSAFYLLAAGIVAGCLTLGVELRCLKRRR